MRAAMSKRALTWWVMLAIGGTAQDSPPAAPLDREEVERILRAAGADVDLELLHRMAEFGDEPALRLLQGMYEGGSILLRREILCSLAGFDAIPALAASAMEFVADSVANAPEPEVQEAGLDVLGGAERLGKHYLRRIVDSAAQAKLREEALVRFVGLATDEDVDYFRELFEKHKNLSGSTRKPSPRRRPDPTAEDSAPIVPKLREVAFEALAPQLENRELIEQFEQSMDPAIRKVSLRELETRGVSQAADLALDTFERVNVPAEDRAEAAGVLVRIRGEKVAAMLLETAKKPATQELLRDRIADLLSELESESLRKKLVAMVGKGKPYEKLFALRATRNVDDERLRKALRRGLGDRDPAVRRATARELGRRQDADATKELDKLLRKPKEPEDAAVALEGLSQVHGPTPEWVAVVEEYTTHEDAGLRNTALRLLGEFAQPASYPVFDRALEHPDWASRRFAVLGMAALRDPRAVPRWIDRLEIERGRMRLELADALWRLTGQPFVDSPDTWKRWWADAEAEFQVLDVAELAAREEQREQMRLRQTTAAPAEFFGVRIISHRVAFVIDVSGSMAELLQTETIDGRPATRMDVVKRELLQCMEALDADALFNLVPFNTAVSPWLEGGLVASEKATRQDAVTFIERLGNRGGTNIHDSLHFAFRDPEVDTIFLLSDGEPTSGAITDAHRIREAVQGWNASRGVVVHCVSVGSSLELLEWLAADSGGRFVQFE